MNFSAIIHQAKSEFSYAYDKETLHIRIKTAKNDVTEMELLAVDPFNWIPRNDGTQVYDFDKKSVVKIKMEKEQETKYYDCWFAEVKGIQWRRVKYCFLAENEKEKYLIGCHDILPFMADDSRLYELSNYFNYPYINDEDLYKAPDWVSDTVWYQIFPERFCNGTPDDGRNVLSWGSDEMDGAAKKFGGNLAGIINKLDYVKNAGFTGIYLTPVFESPSSHKYDTTDYFKIDPEFGDNEDLGKLVEEAHKRGIKVMLDAVFNHCGFSHPFWQDVLKNGANSKYFDCFYIRDSQKPIFDGRVKAGIPLDIPKEKLNYRTFAFTPSMPKWNTGNPIVRKYLLEAACFWIEKYHIDGWRLDVSNEISHDFWREFRKKVKSINPDTYILGENWDNSYPWLMGDQFDAVMNYEFSTPVWNYFQTGGQGNCASLDKKTAYTVREFKYAFGNLLASYPKHVTKNLFNLLESHDTMRVLNRVSGRTDIVKLAYVFLFTFPGSPCVYYGGEIGMSGGEHSNRQCMIWEEEKQDQELAALIRQCAQLRKQYESFRCTALRFLDGGEDEDILLYRKGGQNELLYVFLHKSSREITYSLPEELKGVKCKDCLSGGNVILQNEITLKPYGYEMYIVLI